MFYYIVLTLPPAGKMDDICTQGFDSISFYGHTVTFSSVPVQWPWYMNQTSQIFKHKQNVYLVLT